MKSLQRLRARVMAIPRRYEDDEGYVVEIEEGVPVEEEPMYNWRTLEGAIEAVEDIQDLILEPNAERVREDWWMLGVPHVICKNNPYRLLNRGAEAVRIGLVITNVVKNGIGE